jgi:hypothetical protein
MSNARPPHSKMRLGSTTLSPVVTVIQFTERVVNEWRSLFMQHSSEIPCVSATVLTRAGLREAAPMQ